MTPLALSWRDNRVGASRGALAQNKRASRAAVWRSGSGRVYRGDGVACIGVIMKVRRYGTTRSGIKRLISWRAAYHGASKAEKAKNNRGGGHRGGGLIARWAAKRHRYLAAQRKAPRRPQ